jgi:hypothetical protein
MYYQARDLSAEQRRAAEVLLGHAVSDDDAVSIKSIGLSAVIPSRLSPEERIQALRRLNERFTRTPCPEISEEEELDVVNEAMHSSRPNYRPAV